MTINYKTTKLRNIFFPFSNQRTIGCASWNAINLSPWSTFNCKARRIKRKVQRYQSLAIVHESKVLRRQHANGLKINNETNDKQNVNTLKNINRHFICFPCAPHDVPMSGKIFLCYFLFRSENLFSYLTGKSFQSPFILLLASLGARARGIKRRD